MSTGGANKYKQTTLLRPTAEGQNDNTKASHPPSGININTNEGNSSTENGNRSKRGRYDPEPIDNNTDQHRLQLPGTRDDISSDSNSSLIFSSDSANTIINAAPRESRNTPWCKISKTFIIL
jgi:hypothetical protein